MRQSNLMFNVWLFRANFYSRQFLFPIFGTPIKQKLTSRGSRTPIYEKHHLAQKKDLVSDLSRTPIYEIWADFYLAPKSDCGLILRSPIYEICPMSIPISIPISIFNFNFQFQFSIPINFQFQFHSSNFSTSIFSTQSLAAPRTWFLMVPHNLY
jgi:hypothetical protein